MPLASLAGSPTGSPAPRPEARIRLFRAYARRTSRSKGRDPSQLTQPRSVMLCQRAGGTMSTRALALMLVVTVFVLGAVGIVAQTQRPGDTLQLWDYHTEISRIETRRETGSPDVILNGLGQQGWELVGMTRREMRIDDALMTETIYTFKRPS